MPQPPRNDGWKHTSKPNPAKPSASSPAPNASRKPWQPGAPKLKSKGKATGRVARFIAAGVGVGLLTAAVVWVVLLLFQPKYPSLIVVAGDVPDSLALPENHAGVVSAKGVEGWAADGKAKAKLTAGRDATAEPDAWKTKLDANGMGTVLYFAAHVGVDADGPFLWLPPKGNTAGKSDKLPVKAVLDRLGGLPASQPKLLVIDIAQTPSNWAFGGAYSDFVRAVSGLSAAVEQVPGLAVILSADVDQVSWTADERRKTAFGHYFVEGLRGAVDVPPGGPVTAADLHKYLRREVQKWAVANRGANQEPLLLPAGDGPARAAKLVLATLPNTAYTPPAAPPAAPATPDDLKAEWDRVARLTDSRRGVQPDTTDPLKWREYLEWLLRWERLVRLDDPTGSKAVPDTLPPRVKRLGDELEKRAGDDAACGPVALPAGPALSGLAADTPADGTFKNLWEPPDGSDHTAEWRKLLNAPGAREDALRTAAARFVVGKVLDGNVSRGSLAAAEKVFTAITVGGLLPVEAHYVRMLHLHLVNADDQRRPPADLLRTAITLRRTAEEVAWADGLTYPEQVIRWTLPRVKAADERRQWGEDLLFDPHPESRDNSRKEAAEHFAEAAKGYEAAKGRARTVAAALAARDRVFARLPYYARWVAAARGGPTKAADELLGQLVQAATAAHAIDRLIREVADGGSDADLGRLADETTKADGLKAVAGKYDEFADGLGVARQASDWQTLDAALTVPFRKVEQGRDLSQVARDTAAKLAADPQQLDGTRVPDDATAVQASAARHLRAAAAYLPTLASNAAGQPAVQAAELAAELRKLPGDVERATGVAKETAKLRDAAGSYAEANRLARLSDPAAPVDGTPTPPEADRRFWRHALLLDHARRITLDGWGSHNPTEKVLANLYCSVAAKRVHDSADAELRKLMPDRDNLPPAKQDRLTEELVEVKKLKPKELAVTAAATRVVTDEPKLRYEYTATVTAGERVGYPVREFVTLPAGLGETNPAEAERKVERRLAGQKAAAAVTQAATFKLPEVRAAGGTDKLTVAFRYRGRVYEHETAVAFAGDPKLRVEHTPPAGDAVMAFQSEPDVVAGAVTILIDRTQSMLEPKGAAREKTRFYQARVGVRDLVSRLPKGTLLTIGGFYGKDKEVTCAAIRTPSRLVEPKREAEKLFDDLEKAAEPVNGSYTPLAGAVRTVLDPDTGKAFWPAKYTGQRTLIVLTDGEDTWYDDGNPGYKVDGKGVKDGEQWRVAEAGLKAAVADKDAFGVAVHMVLFGMDDERLVKAQFGKLRKAHETDPELADARFDLIEGVKDGADFAKKLAVAMMPRVRWKREAKKGVMVASLKGDAEYNPTPPLAPGVYDLTGGTDKLPQVQLAAGERAVLRAERTADDKVVLTRPPLAFELARAGNSRPHATDGKLAVTLPQLEYKAGTNSSTLAAVLTLEERDPGLQSDPLKAASRYYAWFDLTDPDGKPFDQDSGPRVTIRNRLADGHELLAPAWDVTLDGWHPPLPKSSSYNRPQVRGYWVNNLPAPPLGVQNVTPRALIDPPADALPLKAFEFGTGKVQVVDAAVSPDKKYLTVWMDYERPGELVLLRVVVGGRSWSVAESHAYYDKHHRYTARFGPLSPDDLDTPLRLELYAVSKLREQAAADGRAVTLPGEKGASALYPLPRLLTLNALK